MILRSFAWTPSSLPGTPPFLCKRKRRDLCCSSKLNFSPVSFELSLLIEEAVWWALAHSAHAACSSLIAIIQEGNRNHTKLPHSRSATVSPDRPGSTAPLSWTCWGSDLAPSARTAGVLPSITTLTYKNISEEPPDTLAIDLLCISSPGTAVSLLPILVKNSCSRRSETKVIPRSVVRHKNRVVLGKPPARGAVVSGDILHGFSFYLSEEEALESLSGT